MDSAQIKKKLKTKDSVIWETTLLYGLVWFRGFEVKKGFRL
jgi:hypothetical protein